MFAKTINFLKNDIWRIRLQNYPHPKSFFLKLLRIIVLAVRGFDENKCKFRASALTYYSLLSVVPVIAVMFGLAKGFGLDERLKAEIYQKMETQKDAANKIIEFSDSLLKNANGGWIAGIGVILLFWTIINVLSSIENSFNDIWGVKKSRTFGRKFADYLSMMLICPFLLIISGSLTVLISDKVQLILQKFSFFSAIGPGVLFLLKYLPYCTLWVLFTFVCIFLPNTKVKFKSGLIAGIVSGTIVQLVQWAYFKFQFGIANYSAIYGSFAALPLFLLWMQISWTVVLFGAELSFAHQNVETYEFEPDCLSASFSFKKLIALLITHQLVKNFCNAEKPSTAQQISHALEIPIRLVREVLFELVESKILSETKNNSDKEASYQPAVDVDKLTIKYVTYALDQRGNSNIPVEKTKELEKISASLNAFAAEIEKSPANLLLKNI